MNHFFIFDISIISFSCDLRRLLPAGVKKNMRIKILSVSYVLIEWVLFSRRRFRWPSFLQGLFSWKFSNRQHLFGKTLAKLHESLTDFFTHRLSRTVACWQRRRCHWVYVKLSVSCGTQHIITMLIWKCDIRNRNVRCVNSSRAISISLQFICKHAERKTSHFSCDFHILWIHSFGFFFPFISILIVEFQKRVAKIDVTWQKC